VLGRCSGRSVTRRSYPRSNLPGDPGFDSREVDLVLAYSNHADLLSPLSDVLERISAGDATAYPGVVGNPQRAAAASPAPQTHTLTDDQLGAIFAGYRQGVGPRELSRRYGVTERAIKYVLKKHGVQRQRDGVVRSGVSHDGAPPQRRPGR
jgi:hypothetical protein